MTLEQILFELSTLVEYGTKYLLDRNSFTEDYAREISLNDFITINNLTNKDISKYICDNFYVHEIFDDEEIKDYVTSNSNFDIQDLFDIEDALEWVQTEYSPEDIVEHSMEWSRRY